MTYCKILWNFCLLVIVQLNAMVECGTGICGDCPNTCAEMKSVMSIHVMLQMNVMM